MMSVMFCGFGLFAHADPAAATVDKVVRPEHLGEVGIGVSDLARSNLFYEFSACRFFESTNLVTSMRMCWVFFSNGTTHVLFSPLDFISKLTALIPKPRHHLVRYHGAFARGCHLPNAKIRQRNGLCLPPNNKKSNSPDTSNPVQRIDPHPIRHFTIFLVRGIETRLQHRHLC